MADLDLLPQVRAAMAYSLPLPGHGRTPERHRILMGFGRRDLSLARILEAHFDAVAILAEAGRQPVANALYGVWASEKPGASLRLAAAGNDLLVEGTKAFCSGAGLVDHALITVREPEELLVDIDLRANADHIRYDCSEWKTLAFSETRTGSVEFLSASVSRDNILGPPRWYLDRPGFWHGACGPAACWGGGAAKLFDYALVQHRDDPHTLAHLGAMQAGVWAMEACLDSAGREIDAAPDDSAAAVRRALIVRHQMEQTSTDILRRFARAFGPHPMSMVGEIARHYQELDLYLRQSHAERDLEVLGRQLRRVQKN